jgi:hypothetical protein
MIEMVVSMTISLMLLTATTGAMVASFRAYGDAVEQAGTQVATRMVTQRLLALVRTSTAHGPLVAGGGATLSGDTITSPFLELVDPNGDIMRCEYRPDDEQLWLIRDPGGDNELAQPLVAGVSAATFSLRRRLDNQGLLVLERATIDITVQPDEDQTLSLENGPAQAVRVIASTMPRKLQ